MVKGGPSEGGVTTLTLKGVTQRRVASRGGRFPLWLPLYYVLRSNGLLPSNSLSTYLSSLSRASSNFTTLPLCLQACGSRSENHNPLVEYASRLLVYRQRRIFFLSS
ncbi:hypothetical protein Tco_1448042 [Tanacetum coccineum]